MTALVAGGANVVVAARVECALVARLCIEQPAPLLLRVGAGTRRERATLPHHALQWGLQRDLHVSERGQHGPLRIHLGALFGPVTLWQTNMAQKGTTSPAGEA